jgi:ribosomal protein L11 methyltransferase
LQAGSKRVRLAVYAEAHDADAVALAVREFLERNGRGAATLKCVAVENRNWSEEWKKSYTSFRFGELFFVVPSWRDDPAPIDCTHTIRIDPGEAFGSGLHETTQMTMASLERLAAQADPGEKILDLGTGSGILAIGARMLGFTRVAACDNDFIAVTVAADNAQRNGTPDIGLFAGSADAVASCSVGILLANLTADVIEGLFPEMDRLLRPSGWAIFSGILTDQGEDVRRLAATHGYSIDEERARGEWIALVCRKHGA